MPDRSKRGRLRAHNVFNKFCEVVLRRPFNREQLRDILRRAQARDLIGRDALDMIEGVLEVAEMQVRDIMIPRSQMDVVDRNLAPEEFLPFVIESAHSRFPVIDGDRDKVVGILLAKDLLRYFDPQREEDFVLRDILRPAVFIPEAKRLNVLLREFRASRNHMAIVVDEYGGVAGLVTIEDVLEQIVGEIQDEHDIDEDQDMVLQRADDEFVVKGLLPLDEFNDRFGTRFDTDEADTVGGLVIGALGHLPRRGEKAELDGLRFEVLHADSRRIYLVRVTRLAQAAAVRAQ